MLLGTGLWIGLTGCSVPLETASKRPLAPLPEEWRNAGAFPVADVGADLRRWWGRFGDPVLDEVMGMALAGNVDVAVAAERIREVRLRRDAERALLFPSVDGSAGAGVRSVRTDRFGSDTADSYSAGLSASWDADLFGGRRSSLEAAAAALGVAEENRHSVEAALASEVAIAYTELRATEARFEVLRRNVKTREQTSQLASWRQRAGEADSLEASQALTSLEQARAGIPALEQAASRARNRLALLIGREPGALDAVLARKNEGIPVPPKGLAVGIPADTVRQRPDVRVAGYQVLAAAANTRVANASRYPSLRLSGSLGVDSANLGDLFDPETLTANLAAGLASPVFDAGRLKAQYEAQRSAEEQAVLEYRRTVLTALAETEDALVACRRTGERLETLEKAAVSAREADALAQQRYEAGEIDFLDVLDAQRTLLGMEDSLLSTRTDRTIAYIRLYEALGGGWSARS